MEGSVTIAACSCGVPGLRLLHASGRVADEDLLTLQQDPVTPPHPRVLGWVGTAALAMGGSNQMIFLITALFVGQEVILGQGSAAVPLLIAGVLLGWAAAPAGPSSS